MLRAAPDLDDAAASIWLEGLLHKLLDAEGGSLTSPPPMRRRRRRRDAAPEPTPTPSPETIAA